MWIEINYSDKCHLFNFDKVENIALDYDCLEDLFIARVHLKSIVTEFYFDTEEKQIDFYNAIKVIVSLQGKCMSIIDGWISAI